MSPEERRRLKAAMDRADRWRGKKTRTGKYALTCPASRHLHIMADCVVRKAGYPMLHEEPVHCAETMLAVLAELWRLRAASRDYERDIDKALEQYGK